MSQADMVDESESAEIGEELPDELPKNNSLSLRGWLVVVAIIILLPLLWITSVFTRMGVITLPFFSGRMYSPVETQREIVPLAGYRMEDVISTFVARSKYDATTGFIDTFIKEQELTTIIAQALSETEDAPFEVMDAQMVVEEGFVEMFMRLDKDGRVIPVRIQILPSTDGQVLQVEILEVVIGGYALPDVLVNLIYSVSGEKIVSSAQDSLSLLGPLRSLVLEQGKVEMTVDPSAKIQNR